MTSAREVVAGVVARRVGGVIDVDAGQQPVRQGLESQQSPEAGPAQRSALPS